MQHHGISNIRIEGPYSEGVKYVRDAERTLIRLQGMLQAGGVMSGGLYARINDRAYCYARVAGNVNVVSIVVDSEAPVLTEAFERETAPDFLSGMVYTGRLEQRVDRSDPGNPRYYDTLVDFRPTQATALKFDLAPIRQEIERLGIRPHEDVADALDNPSPTATVVYSQYTRLRPTMFSGAMKKLVQFLLGYGKQGPKSVYGSMITTDIGEQDPPTEFQKEVARDGYKMRFDWRFPRTHGLTKASDGRWWLVEVRQEKGVHAMPLELHQQTTTESFRAKLESMEDREGLAVLDLFGGFPTGEGFPRDSVEFDSLVRAGLILAQQENEGLDEFYEHTAYSSYMGWAFSESGARAHNTAWRYGDDGVQRGVHYGIEIQIGDSEEIDPHPMAPALKKHVRRANGAPYIREFEQRLRGVLFKIDRMEVQEIVSMLGRTPAAAFSAIDAQRLDGIAPFSAPCGLVGEGKIYWPTRAGPQIKFYEPMLDGLMSHDMRPAFRIARRPFCDTVMHVYFMGEALKYVKYYSPGERETINSTEGETPECPYATDWTIITRSGAAGEIDGFYTTEFDDRAFHYENETIGQYRSEPTGRYTIVFGDSPVTPWISFMSKTWLFRLRSLVTTRSGTNKANAVAIPQYLREGYYYAYIEGNSGTTVALNYASQAVGDPHSYIGWRNFPGFNAPVINGVPQLQEHPAGCGKVTARTVWYENYSPTTCSDIVDKGPWASVCQTIEEMAVTMTVYLPPNSVTTQPATRTLRVELAGFFEPQQASVETRTGNDAQYLGEAWGEPSPDENGFVQFITAYANALGDGDTLVYAKDINTPADQIRGSPRFDDMKGAGFTFIGAING